MNLTPRQIALLVASILVYKEELDKSSVLTQKELDELIEILDELIEILDEEYQTIIEETK